jgi:dihydrofolate reductase
MRKVILGMHITLDGYISGPNDELDWAVWDEEVDDATIPNTLGRADTALLGRVMYEQFYGYWPTKQAPFFSKGEEEFAKWINSVPKVVFSNTLQSVEWDGTVVGGDIATAIANLKDQPGGDMLLVGGVRLPQSLVRLGLVDEYQLLISPVVLGAGKRLFEDRPDRMKLKLTDVKPFASGAVQLTYEKESAG